MRLAWVLVSLSLPASIGAAQSLAEEAWGLEVRGDAARAQARLQQAAAAPNAPPASIRAYAEFLDRYRDPGARPAYDRLAQALDRANAPAADRAAVYRRLAALDLAAGDREAAARDLEAHRAAGGAGLSL